MNSYRQLLLRANAAFLGVAATGGMISDLRGSFLGQGPIAQVLGDAPHAAIGFVEAHGLALIFAVLLWRSASSRSSHATAATIHALLGICNLVFWDLFASADMLAIGYVTTILHGLFFILQAHAAIGSRAGGRDLMQGS